MSVEANKATIRRWIAARNAHDLEGRGVLAAAERAELRRAFAAITVAFPDVRITPEELIAEGDKVVVHWTLRGTHRGPFRGLPPTGRLVAWPGVDVYTVVAGQITELVRAADTLALLEQLGAAPPPAG